MKVGVRSSGTTHVDRAVSAPPRSPSRSRTLITRYAWGEIWSRPGLSRPERSLVTLAVLAALQHEQELAMHVKAALRNGLTPEQIQEVLLQVAVYAGVPAGEPGLPDRAARAGRSRPSRRAREPEAARSPTTPRTRRPGSEVVT